MISARVSLITSLSPPSVFLIQFKYDKIYLSFTAESVCLCGICSLVVVLVPYVDAVTVVRVLLWCVLVASAMVWEGGGCYVCVCCESGLCV